MKVFIVALVNKRDASTDVWDGAMFPLVAISGVNSPEEAILAAQEHIEPEQIHRVTAVEVPIIEAPIIAVATKVFIVALVNNRGDWNDVWDGAAFPLVVISGVNSSEEAILAAQEHIEPEQLYRVTAVEVPIIAVATKR